MTSQAIITKDVFAENDCLHFDYLETAWACESIPRLSAITVRARNEDSDRHMALMHVDCANRTAQLINKTGRQTYLFLADAPWQPKSAMVRYKQLWKRYPRALQLDQDYLSQEIMVESSEGLRYGGIARIAEDRFSLACQIAWEEPHGAFLIVTRADGLMDPSVIRSLMDIAFPESKTGSAHMVDLVNVCANLCARGDAIGRVSGDWDARVVAIDLIMLPECLDEFS